MLRQDTLVHGNKAALLAHLRSIWEMPESLQQRLADKNAQLESVLAEVDKHQAALDEFDTLNPQVRDTQRTLHACCLSPKTLVFGLTLPPMLRRSARHPRKKELPTTSRATVTTTSPTMGRWRMLLSKRGRS